MRILIVEDDEYKANAIQDFLSAGHLEREFARAQSMRSGVQALSKTQPDLLILDMNLPTYDSEPSEPSAIIDAQGGREVLRQLHRKCLQTAVIVVTQYDVFGLDGSAVTRAEMSTQLGARYQRYLGTVHYRYSGEAWKADLSELVARFLGNSGRGGTAK